MIVRPPYELCRITRLAVVKVVIIICSIHICVSTVVGILVVVKVVIYRR